MHVYWMGLTLGWLKKKKREEKSDRKEVSKKRERWMESQVEFFFSSSFFAFLFSSEREKEILDSPQIKILSWKNHILQIKTFPSMSVCVCVYMYGWMEGCRTGKPSSLWSVRCTWSWGKCSEIGIHTLPKPSRRRKRTTKSFLGSYIIYHIQWSVCIYIYFLDDWLECMERGDFSSSRLSLEKDILTENEIKYKGIIIPPPKSLTVPTMNVKSSSHASIIDN